MLRKNKKSKPRLPTEEEFQKFRPKRKEFKWTKNEEGLVEIIVPKFTSKLGKSFCETLVRRDNNLVAKLDEKGTIIWENSDGNTTVKKILEVLMKKFPNEDQINQRLYLFLLELYNLGYIEL